ncbi:UPF0548 protein At2g17695 isoform X4 [Ziziphus jujuba]|uniref:UPF0548 protein At2g17695 isoform X4 n=1 Tax=Ziziphus jujuba TaxID=326968 RepID=A0ABM4ADL7_ZIZJJ|nr:UPF0548 protein At2g17695 isoform X4 [Ziziphus jujuba]
MFSSSLSNPKHSLSFIATNPKSSTSSSSCNIIKRWFSCAGLGHLLRNRSLALTARSGAFNYDAKYRGATAKPLSCLKEDKELSHEGFALNHARVLVGSGIEAYEKGKNALQAWRHFGLNWAFVDPKTPVQNGAKFCVCVKEFLPWVMMPLKVVYVDEKSTKQSKASFCFGSGTLQGHLLAGEERFSIELDENDQVWYEILSFSKPAHVLSFIGYPYVMLRQKYFSHQSTNAVLKHLNPLQS